MTVQVVLMILIKVYIYIYIYIYIFLYVHTHTHTHKEYEDKAMQYFDDLSNERNNIGFIYQISHAFKHK